MDAMIRADMDSGSRGQLSIESGKSDFETLSKLRINGYVGSTINVRGKECGAAFE